jgi:small subunit ribosomal protein S20
MPIIKSAIKRMRQNVTRNTRNTITRNKYRALIKEFLKLIDDKKIADAVKLFPKMQKSIDLATKKKIIEKNTAGRKKSQLAKLLTASQKSAPAKSAAIKKEEEVKKTKK